jgi:hypothetical protein
MLDVTGSHSSDYETHNLLAGSAMYSDLNLLAFQRPPSSRQKNKPCKKPASRALSGFFFSLGDGGIMCL